MPRNPTAGPSREDIAPASDLSDSDLIAEEGVVINTLQDRADRIFNERLEEFKAEFSTVVEKTVQDRRAEIVDATVETVMELVEPKLMAASREATQDRDAEFLAETWNQVKAEFAKRVSLLETRLEELSIHGFSASPLGQQEFPARRIRSADFPDPTSGRGEEEDPRLDQVAEATRHLSDRVDALAESLSQTGNISRTRQHTRATGSVPENPSWDDEEGPLEEGLVPLKAREPAFDLVVSYRYYRLKNKSLTTDTPTGKSRSLYKLTEKIRNFNASFTPFDGTEPIDILRFLAEFQDACDSCGVSEGEATKLLKYFLEGEPQRFIAAEARKRKLLNHLHQQITWPQAVNALLARYATDNVLADAYDAVTRIRQGPDEDEAAYADRLQDAALLCANVFSERDLVNYYLKGLRPEVKHTVKVTIGRSGGEDFLAVRNLAKGLGDSLRASLPAKPKAYPTREIAERKRKALLATVPGEPAVIPRTPPPTLPSPTGNPMGAPMQAPTLTGEHLKLAESMIPEGAVTWRCSGCRQPEHVLYTCPYLPPSVGTYFAFANYAYQQEAEQVMRRQQRQSNRFNWKRDYPKAVLQRSNPPTRMVAFADDETHPKLGPPRRDVLERNGSSVTAQDVADALETSDDSDTSSEN